MLQRTGPAYDAASKYYTGLMNNPLTSPGITAAQLQFNSARQNVINSSYSRGGALDAGLANVEAGRAATLSQLITGGQQTAAAGLSGLATGQGAQGLAGLAGAQASSYQNSLLNAQGMQGIGSFLARLLSTPGLFGGGSNNNSAGSSSVNIPGAIIGGTDTYNGGSFFPGTGNA